MVIHKNNQIIIQPGKLRDIINNINIFLSPLNAELTVQGVWIFDLLLLAAFQLSNKGS